VFKPLADSSTRSDDGVRAHVTSTAGRPISSESQKQFFRGTHRLIPPEATWQHVKPLLRGFGITRIADTTHLDEVGVPVWAAIRPAAKTLSVSQGKGLTAELARVSAAMEAIEIALAEEFCPPTVHSSASRLAALLTYRVTDLLRPEPSLLCEDILLDWVEGTIVGGGRSTFVPLDYVRISSVVRRDYAPPLFRTSSNGLASGNCFEEALCHALYEVIERDSLFQLHQHAASEQPRVDLDTVDTEDGRWLLDRFQAAGNYVEVLDATGDLGIPCFECRIWSPNLPVVFRGAGCHLDASVALSRALTEAVQVRVTTISGAREDLSEVVFSAQHGPTPRPPLRSYAVTVPFGLHEGGASPTLDEDAIAIANQLLFRRGISAIVIPISHRELPITVVKVVAPGLRHEGDVTGPLGAAR